MLSILQILSSKSRFHDIDYVVAQFLALIDKIDVYGTDDVVVLTLIHSTYVFFSQLLAHQIDLVFDTVGFSITTVSVGRKFCKRTVKRMKNIDGSGRL